MATYKGKSIANVFITLARRDGIDIGPLKLQKLLYYANGYYMAEADGQPLINEYFEAWDYGPVIPTVYYEFREFANSPIRRFAYTYDERVGRSVIAPIPVGDSRAMEVVGWVWENYKHFSASELSRMTHKVGSPWDLARRRAANLRMRNERLDFSEIVRAFKELSASDAA